MECIYCKAEAKYQMKNGKWCCSPSPNSCPERRKKNSSSQKGIKKDYKVVGFSKGNTPWNKGKSYNRDKIPLNDVLVENSNYARHALKRRILEEDRITYECQICGIGPEWQGKPMVLILDHINGVNNDNRLENLRFVCSNCDSQLPTYKARNK